MRLPNRVALERQHKGETTWDARLIKSILDQSLAVAHKSKPQLILSVDQDQPLHIFVHKKQPTPTIWFQFAVATAIVCN